jgi:serine/threonine protein kinase
MSFRGQNPGLSRSSLAPGTQLNGTYEIGDLISSGGMGEVYRGHNIATGDPVAIKVVLPEYAADQLILDLFRKEARILYQLAHDAIVRYYGFASDRDLNRSYMAMEFVEGPSLADQMRQAPLGVAEVAGLKTRLADGLQRAHELGIIHRDISPENVILQGGHVSRAKIIDFGIAKSSALASEGTLIGTTFAGRYNYASPEQVGMFRPQTVSTRSDIYSLGLVLAAALRGTPIDMSGTMAEIMEKRMSVPDLSDIPEEMRELLTAMLEPNPEHRVASMADVRDWPILDGDGQPIQQRRAPPAPMPLSVDPSPASTARISSKRPPQLRPSSKSPPKISPTRPGMAEDRKSGSRAGLWIGIGVVAVMLAGAGGGWFYVKSKFPDSGGTVASNQDVVTPPKQQQTEQPQPKTETETPATQKTDVQPPEPPKQPEIVVPPKQPEVTAQPKQEQTPPPPPVVAPGSIRSPVQMSDYIASYDGGACFFAWPRELKTDAARISVFAFNSPAFEGFYEAFKTASGIDPVINVHKITEAQCAAVDAIKQLIRSKVPVPTLALVQSRLPPGGVLMGEMKDIIPGKMLEILRVDEAGRTFRLTGLANAGSFTAKLGSAAGGPAVEPMPQLAIVLSSPKPLKTLASLDDQNSVPAADLFPKVLDEAEASGKVSVAVQFFVVGPP